MPLSHDFKLLSFHLPHASSFLPPPQVELFVHEQKTRVPDRTRRLPRKKLHGFPTAGGLAGPRRVFFCRSTRWFTRFLRFHRTADSSLLLLFFNCSHIASISNDHRTFSSLILCRWSDFVLSFFPSLIISQVTRPFLSSCSDTIKTTLCPLSIATNTVLRSAASSDDPQLI